MFYFQWAGGRFSLKQPAGGREHSDVASKGGDRTDCEYQAQPQTISREEGGAGTN